MAKLKRVEIYPSVSARQAELYINEAIDHSPDDICIEYELLIENSIAVANGGYSETMYTLLINAYEEEENE